MSGGMATIAGGVLAAFIGMLGQELAIHLIMASVMSAPAAIVAAKILVPETESFESTLEVERKNTVANELEAISQGTTDGIKLAVNVGAMLLVFMALMFMINYILLKFQSLHLQFLVQFRHPSLLQLFLSYENHNFQLFNPLESMKSILYE